VKRCRKKNEKTMKYTNHLDSFKWYKQDILSVKFNHAAVALVANNSDTESRLEKLISSIRFITMFTKDPLNATLSWVNLVLPFRTNLFHKLGLALSNRPNWVGTCYLRVWADLAPETPCSCFYNIRCWTKSRKVVVFIHSSYD
jgi:hypothetical protein